MSSDRRSVRVVNVLQDLDSGSLDFTAVFRTALEPAGTGCIIHRQSLRDLKTSGTVPGASLHVRDSLVRCKAHPDDDHIEDDANDG